MDVCVLCIAGMDVATAQAGSYLDCPTQAQGTQSVGMDAMRTSCSRVVPGGYSD